MPLKVSEIIKLIEADGWYQVATRFREATVTNYAVVIERADDGGYGAWSPDLPGVIALAESEADVLGPRP